MKTPITREDYVKIGRRHKSEHVVDIIDRLIPLAASDIEVLSGHCYGQNMLDELKSYCTRLREGSATCRKLYGEKKGARLSEEEAIREGNNVLRCGISMAEVAINQRQAPQGESIQTTREIVGGLIGQLKSLRGTFGRNSSELRSRLETLKVILSTPDFSNSPAISQSVIQFLPRVEFIIGKLSEYSQQKKAKRDDSKDQEASLDEVIGRAHTNLRLMVQVGKTAYRDLGDPSHAELYSLNASGNHQHESSSNKPSLTSAKTAPAVASTSS